MKVSVLISAFNRPEWLGETLYSVLRSTYQDIEVLVRNSSGPNYREAVDNIVNLDWRRNGEPFKIKLSHGINKCATHSHNILFKASEGEYITPISDDDRIDPDMIERLVDLVQTCDLAVCQPRFIDKNGDPHKSDSPWRISSIVNMDREAMRRRLYQGTPFVGGSLFRRSLVERLGPGNETLYNLSDLDFYLKVVEIGEIKVIEERLYEFRIHDSNTSLIQPDKQARLQDELKRIRRAHFGKQVSNCQSTLEAIANMDPMSRLGWKT